VYIDDVADVAADNVAAVTDVVAVADAAPVAVAVAVDVDVAVRTRAVMTEMTVTVMVMAMATVLVPINNNEFVHGDSDGDESGYDDCASGVDDDAGDSHSDGCGNDGSD